MKTEPEYFAIEGAFGGNQDWFSNVVMNMGGCAAATACDSCIYFAKYMGMRALYPYDINNLTKEDYKRFSQVMKPYILVCGWVQQIYSGCAGEAGYRRSRIFKYTHAGNIR